MLARNVYFMCFVGGNTCVCVYERERERERAHALEPCQCEEEQNLRYWYLPMVAYLWLNELGVKLAMAFCYLCAVEV